MRLRNARYAAVLAAGALSLTACSAGGGGGPAADSGAKAAADTITVGTAADSVGPATPVPGAKKGGTVYDLEQEGINHLDPAQAYTQETMIVSQLFARTLTGYRIDPKTGATKLVGDLATDTGEPSDGDRTWTFHLKSGLKWQDGTAITSDQVKYGFERLYASFETEGPSYVQTWLSGTDFRKAYQGPYGGKSLPDSSIATPDSKTVVFHFLAPHSDAPYAMALPDAGPVLKSKDTRTGYDNAPFSDGPYKIQHYDSGKELVLNRNPYWDAKSDPIRQAYPDTWDLQLDISQLNLTQRLMAESGQDKDALALVAPADPSQTEVIATDPAKYKSRLVSQYQPYVEVFNLNTSRIKDVKVRQAIAYAMPIKQVQTALGGSPQGDLGTSLIGPTVAGHQASDPFGKLATPQGDPAKAKQLLAAAGVKHLTLTFAYRNEDRWQTVARTLQNAFSKAGIDLRLKAVDATSWYSQISKVDNPYDIYVTSWSADWPSASTVIPPTMDGRLLADGDPDYSHLDDSHVNSEIDRINKITDLKQQAAQWQALATDIIKNDTPVVPYLYDKYYNVYGDGLGGVTYNTPLGTINPGSVYVK
ncbi:ABC transporter substrate-binding protein [Streptomyces sp. SL13]|uniref:ABC transporter substrate-binding protein n=1 Tax=Streptantibioticus silvisoli TaxID=2705255 RepID=A0AA90KGE8_9ACTN|nr:ABC transporter substrate-binding protein [Streptantibioticus silvisoli]MDI5963922.1 ABC transporter substrate-binding protein [Streptantibioticus silvisoli]MDI5970470.1 ABC transporter substrate-binding protein [Streptantibioticus silvisoli]